MDVRSIQSSSVYTGAVKQRGGQGTAEQPNGVPSRDDRSRADTTGVLSTDEKSFFEGLFPESGKDIRAYQAYSDKGDQQQKVPTGTMVDRRG